MLGGLDETPVTKRKLRVKKYSERKLEIVIAKMGAPMLGESPSGPYKAKDEIPFYGREHSVKVQD